MGATLEALRTFVASAFLWIGVALIMRFVKQIARNGFDYAGPCCNDGEFCTCGMEELDYDEAIDLQFLGQNLNGFQDEFAEDEYLFGADWRAALSLSRDGTWSVR